MGTRVRGLLSGRLSGATLWVVFSTLAGCNVVAGLLGVGFTSWPTTSSPPAEADAAQRELSVSLRPGVALFQAIDQAPRAAAALDHATHEQGELSLSGIGANLLGEGLLLPGPLGLIEVRLEVPPRTAEPIAVTALAVDPVSPGLACTAVTVPPALVGAYRAGSRLLLLRTDGQFVLRDGAQPAQTGSYALDCQVLKLASDARPALPLTQLGADSWRDPGGDTFLPLTEQPHGEVR